MTRAKRILMIENEPIKIGTLRRALEEKGYLIEVIDNYDAAKKTLNCKWVPLAIVDIRLVDELSVNDYTGLDLITKESDRAIKKVILTAYPTYEAAREALVAYQGEIPPAVDFLYKLDPINELVKKIEKAIRNLGINWDLDVKFDGHQTFISVVERMYSSPSRDKDGLSRCQDIHEFAEEFQDLLSKLFNQNNKIVLYPLPPGRDDTLVTMVKPYGGLGKESIVVAKCGWRHCIKEEKDKYDIYVKKHLELAPKLDAFETTLHFGGLIYSLVGVGHGVKFEHSKRFADFYRSTSSAEISSAIDDLFNKTLSGWNELATELSNDGIDQEYRFNLKLDEKRHILIERVNDLYKHSHELGILIDRDKKLTWANDLKLDLKELLEIIYETPKIMGKETLSPYLKVVSHGDLNSGNILVDLGKPPIVIDFSETGYGYILRDFAELETIIALDLLELPDLNEIISFEEIVCDQINLEKLEIPLNQTNQENEFNKALKIILSIRNYAFKKRERDILRRYYLALLFEAVRRMIIDGRDSLSSTNPIHRLAHAALRAATLIQSIKRLY
jgi:ActR/RegA family two-component response regulator